MSSTVLGKNEPLSSRNPITVVFEAAVALLSLGNVFLRFEDNLCGVSRERNLPNLWKPWV